VRELAAWHRPRLEALAEAGPDVLALETVPDTDEAEALMTAIAGLGIPAWLSYTIASGADPCRAVAGRGVRGRRRCAGGGGRGVNCCTPADVPMAIAAAREVTGKPVIVYPNSGETWDARRRAPGRGNPVTPPHSHGSGSQRERKSSAGAAGSFPPASSRSPRPLVARRQITHSR
jgi:S-methylmethionine-dependent homocysteine/selenocysteine methylase